jgi:hypothetical protein
MQDCKHDFLQGPAGLRAVEDWLGSNEWKLGIVEEDGEDAKMVLRVQIDDGSDVTVVLFCITVDTFLFLAKSIMDYFPGRVMKLFYGDSLN